MFFIVMEEKVGKEERMRVVSRVRVWGLVRRRWVQQERTVAMVSYGDVRYWARNDHSKFHASSQKETDWVGMEDRRNLPSHQ